MLNLKKYMYWFKQPKQRERIWKLLSECYRCTSSSFYWR